MNPTSSPPPVSAPNSAINDQDQTRWSEILDEQKDAHAVIVSDLTRELNRLSLELQELKLERPLVWVMLALAVVRIRRSRWVNLILSKGLKAKIARVLTRVGF